MTMITKQRVRGDLGLFSAGEQELPTQVSHTGFLFIKHFDDDEDDDDDDDNDGIDDDRLKVPALCFLSFAGCNALQPSAKTRWINLNHDDYYDDDEWAPRHLKDRDIVSGQ